MKYRILMTDRPIKFEKVAPLSKLGLIIPYDSVLPEINTYGYYNTDIDDATKVKIRHILDKTRVTFTSDEVTLEAIQRQASKIQASNPVIQGSIVYHRDYKKLPFLVTYSDGKRATIFHNMRVRPLTIECKAELLRPTDGNHELPTYAVGKPTIEFKSKVYVDCDIFPYTNIDEYYRRVFILVLQLKMSMPYTAIVLLNPITRRDDIVTLMGLESQFGNILRLVDALDGALLISNSKLIHHKRLQGYDGNRAVSREFIVGQETDSQVYLRGLVDNQSYIKDTLLHIKNGHISAPQPANYTPKAKTTTLPAQQPTQRDLVRSQLRAVGLDPFTTRLDDLIYFITGQEFKQ